LSWTGDNGGQTYSGHSNAPLRGGKFNWYEGGTRSASFISAGAGATDLLPARDRIYLHPVHATDWVPTFADLAGVSREAWPHGDGLTLDGVSLVGPGGALLPQPDKPVRTEMLLSIRVGFEVQEKVSYWSKWGVIRVGDFKLITQDPNW
jgi:arylsulfatase A-like enzyme